jgi:hypothetical protein
VIVCVIRFNNPAKNPILSRLVQNALESEFLRYVVHFYCPLFECVEGVENFIKVESANLRRRW